MPRKRFKTEEIIQKLREAEVLLSQDRNVSEDCRQKHSAFVCQHSGFCSARSSATGCEMRTTPKAQRKRPRHRKKRLQAMMCEPVRLNSQIAEEGLEVSVEFNGKNYILAFARDF